MINRSKLNARRIRVIFTGMRTDLAVLGAAVTSFKAIASEIDTLALVLDALPGDVALGGAQECAVTLLPPREVYRLGYGCRPDRLLATATACAVRTSRLQFDTVIALPPRAFPIAGVEPLLEVLQLDDIEPDPAFRFGWWGASSMARRPPVRRHPASTEIAGLEEATSTTGFAILPLEIDVKNLPLPMRDLIMAANTGAMPNRRYRFGYFSNGVPFDSVARELYLEALDDGLDFGDPGDATADPSFYQWLSAASPSEPTMSRYVRRYRMIGRSPLSELHPSWQSDELASRIGAGRIASTAGVNLVGLLRAELGIGEAGRSMVKALKRAGEPVSMSDISEVSASRQEDRTFAAFTNRPRYATSLLCVNPPEYSAFFQSGAGEAFADGRYRIGSWWWELPDLPSSWLEAFNAVDELWIGSHFVEEAVRRCASVPVIYVPPIVELPLFNEPDRSEFGLRKDETIVLFIFDFNSEWQRKNPAGAIDAFRRAFHHAEPVRMVVKTINADRHREKADLLREVIDGDHQITWIEGYLDRFALLRLIRTCDVYLSLHRSEGFGLTIAEAMLLEKPVVVTNWSGNLDFTRVENSFPVDASVVKLDKDYGPYFCGSKWAEPDLDHAALQLRTIVNDPSGAARRASLGRYQVGTQFSTARVARIIRDRLDAIRTVVRTA